MALYASDTDHPRDLRGHIPVSADSHQQDASAPHRPSGGGRNRWTRGIHELRRHIASSSLRQCRCRSYSNGTGAMGKVNTGSLMSRSFMRLGPRSHRFRRDDAHHPYHFLKIARNDARVRPVRLGSLLSEASRISDSQPRSFSVNRPPKRQRQMVRLRERGRILDRSLTGRQAGVAMRSPVRREYRG